MITSGGESPAAGHRQWLGCAFQSGFRQELFTLLQGRGDARLVGCELSKGQRSHPCVLRVVSYPALLLPVCPHWLQPAPHSSRGLVHLAAPAPAGDMSKLHLPAGEAGRRAMGWRKRSCLHAQELPEFHLSPDFLFHAQLSQDAQVLPRAR